MDRRLYGWRVAFLNARFSLGYAIGGFTYADNYSDDEVEECPTCGLMAPVE